MASEADTISANDGDFYAEYHHEAHKLRVVIKTPSGPLVEVSTVGFGVWLELKSCADPMRTYLRLYRPKPPKEEKTPIFISPATRKPRSEAAAGARRHEEADRPMGCGMKLFLFWLGASALTFLVLLIAEQFKR
jgi:hypothetical protein